ncbi:MAG: hypothetical protein DWQ08_02705, partial [Proteobacteria bacterium]
MISDWFAQRIGRLAVGRPVFTLVMTLIWVAAFGAGVRYLDFTNDYRVFFSDENPQLRAFRELENAYTQFDNVLFVLSPDDGDVFTADSVEAIRYLTESAWQIPYTIRVDSLTNFQHSYADGDDLVVRDLAGPDVVLDSAGLARIEDIALREPYVAGLLVSKNGAVAGVNVSIQLPGKDQNVEVPRVADAARALAEDFRDRFSGHSVYLTGINMLNHAFSEESRRDMRTLIPASFVLVLVLIGLILRRATATVATLWVIAFSVVAAMGFAGWVG